MLDENALVQAKRRRARPNLKAALFPTICGLVLAYLITVAVVGILAG